MNSLEVQSGKRPRVVYWNNLPAPYMVERFNAVAASGRLDFEAWFSARSNRERSWQVEESTWQFEYRFLPSVSLGRWSAAIPTPLLTGTPPDLLVSLYESGSFVAGWWIARSRGARTAFWTEVTFDSWVRRRAWKERLKRYLFRRVDAVITVGEDGRRFALRYGADPTRILLAPHAIDVEHFRAASDQARRHRSEHRRTLGVTGTVILYVGRLWEGKGLNYLLEAFAGIQHSNSDVTLLLVGDGAMQRQLRARSDREGLNVVIAGFRDKGQLPAIYAAASSLPVITTPATGELGLRVVDGVTGIVVPPASADALRGGIQRCLDDLTGMKQMAAAASQVVAGRTPQRWAADFERAVFATLSRPTIRE